MSEGNGFASREMFVRKAPRRYREIEVPGFGKVRIQSLSEGERSRYEGAVLNRKGGLRLDRLEQAKRRLMVLCIVDAQGNCVLQGSDEASLQNMDAALAQVIYDACREHCGFDKGDIEELAEKNSEQVHVESSP